MGQELRIQAAWDEVAGKFSGHIEGLPEIILHGGQTPESFEDAVEAAVERLHLMHRDPIVIHYGPRPASLDIAA